MSQKQNDLGTQIDSFYNNHAGKPENESATSLHQELLADRVRWLALFGKSENDVYTDKDGDHIFAEIESEGDDGETVYNINRQNLPEMIQSKNINL